MDIQIFRKGKTFKHPLEDCVLRTVPNLDGWETYIRFSKKPEYKPVKSSNIVIDSLFGNEPEWITKEEY